MAIKSAVNAFVLECIRRRRLESGLRVQDMAEMAGIPLGSYSCLETGCYRLSLENLFRIIAVLGLEIEDVWPRPLRKVEKVTGAFIRQSVEVAERNWPKPVSYDEILATACEVYGINMEDLSSPSRKRDLSEARTVATILVRKQPHLTLVGLSHLIKRDVSSLSHCLRRLEWRLKYDKRLKLILNS